jgi:magnesium chelatase subunit D
VRLRFSAVVGLDEAKAALLYAAVEPRLGGVLLRGEKGSAKTTLARGLAALLPGDAPFVELPLGATEERVLGSLDLPELLTAGTARFRPGLLAAADGGVLYVDEINLLADHLVDALLDVAVSGVNRVERDGLSHTHPARFVLIGSMNPEEGELRPQLLDRFGLAADVKAPRRADERAVAVRRQLDAERPAADKGATADEGAATDQRWRERVMAARDRAVTVSEDVVERASRLALEVGAEGLRADLMLCRAAAAAAALDGRSAVGLDDVRAVAGLVLAHRRRRRPFDEPGISPDELTEAWEAAGEQPPPPTTDGDGAQAPSDPRQDAPGPDRSDALDPPRRQRASSSAGGFGRSEAQRGRFVREAPFEGTAQAAVDPRGTAVALATRRAATGDDTAQLTTEDLRSGLHERKATSAVIFVVDASASMGVERRMAASKAAVLGLLGDAYRRRGTVGLITFRGDGAEVVLRPTGSVEIARARLTDLETGGRTPLAAGLDEARRVVEHLTDRGETDCTVVLVTDGRATVGEPDPVTAARVSFEALARTGARLVVLDTETGPSRLSLAVELATSAGAEYRQLDATGVDLETAVRAL